jgi:hypothetical protein
MNVNTDEIVVVLRTRTYLTAKQGAELYGMAPCTLRKMVKDMEKSRRYNRFLILNQNGTQLFNSLMLEDWLSVKHLYDAGLQKHAAPYDAAEVRKARGEE